MTGRPGAEPFTRITESTLPDGRPCLTHEGPGEIASWFFPHETERDAEARDALQLAIEELIERTVARMGGADGWRDR